jgi:photosystem II stability/assembly factor-like uncharacterized protein
VGADEGFRTDRRASPPVLPKRCGGALGSPFGPNDERGVFKTTDGGKTWKKTLFVNNETGGRDIEVDWENPDILYAAMYKGFRKGWDIISGGPASEGGIYKSTDGGETWKKITAGLPGRLIGKIDIDIARSNPKVLYAMVEAPGAEGGLFRSNDAGESWTLVNSSQRLRRIKVIIHCSNKFIFYLFYFIEFFHWRLCGFFHFIQ